MSVRTVRNLLRNRLALGTQVSQACDPKRCVIVYTITGWYDDRVGNYYWSDILASW